MFDADFLPANGNLTDNSELEPYGSDLSNAVLVHYIINVYVDGFLIIAGLLGNMAAIVILKRENSQMSNNVYLQALSAYDILFLVVMSFYTTMRTVYLATGNMDEYYTISPYIIAITLPIGWIAQTGNIWFTLAAAMDRYLAISKPFRAVELCTKSRAHKVCVFISVGATLFNLPRFVHYYLVALHTAGENSTFVSHIKYDMPGWNTDVYHYFYHVTLTYTLIYALPLASLIYCNTCLIRSLHASHTLRKEHSRRQSADNMLQVNFQVTLNVVVLITKFVLCITPDFMGGVVGSVGVPLGDSFMVFATIAQMLLVFNSAANFYIYCIFHSKFRKALCFCKTRFCCPFMKGKDGKDLDKIHMHAFKASNRVDSGSMDKIAGHRSSSIADLTPTTSVSLLAVKHTEEQSKSTI